MSGTDDRQVTLLEGLATTRAIRRYTDAEIPDGVRDELPGVLWLFHMGLILFWVHDSSPDQAATKLATARTVPLVVRAIGLVEIPELKALIDELISLVCVARALLGWTSTTATTTGRRRSAGPSSGALMRSIVSGPGGLR